MVCNGCDSKAKKLKSIISGWRHYIWPDPGVEVEALERAAICSECDRSKAGFCLECGCIISAKIRSTKEKCSMGYW